MLYLLHADDLPTAELDDELVELRALAQDFNLRGFGIAVDLRYRFIP